MIEMKVGHNNSPHIEETKLDKNEAVYFIDFLEEEIARHKLAIRQCDYLMHFFNQCDVLIIAYRSSIKGHLYDIEQTQKTIDYLRNKFKEER